MNTTSPFGIDGTMTVNEVISLHPHTVEIFNAHQIDACCGGDIPLHEAALGAGIHPEALVEEIRMLLGGAE